MRKSVIPIQSWIIPPKNHQKLLPAFICLLVLGFVGLLDYLEDFVADYRALLTVLYVLPIGCATLYVNWGFAVFLAVLSIVSWNGGDILAGAPSPGNAIRLWNDGIVFAMYSIIIYLLNTLGQILTGLETTVEERTRELRAEMEERKRLEQQILELTERERQSFGQELHDAVCQELAGTAIASQMLVQKLQSRGRDEAADAKEVSAMVYHSLTQARNVAKGHFTAGFDALGLADALRSAVAQTQERSGIRCDFRWQDNLAISNEDVVMHFFRIAQEALQNAVRHSGASHIEVRLETEGDWVQLVIEDNGKGLSETEIPREGLGLRIMAYRTGIIGGKFKAEKSSPGGTRIVCMVPIANITAPAATTL